MKAVKVVKVKKMMIRRVAKNGKVYEYPSYVLNKTLYIPKSWVTRFGKEYVIERCDEEKYVVVKPAELKDELKDVVGCGHPYRKTVELKKAVARKKRKNGKLYEYQYYAVYLLLYIPWEWRKWLEYVIEMNAKEGYVIIRPKGLG